MIMLACEAFSADHSVDKSARDSVGSKSLYGRLRFPLMDDELFFAIIYCYLLLRWTLLTVYSPLPQNVAFCVRPCIVGYNGVVETKGHFSALLRLEANIKLASIS